MIRFKHFKLLAAHRIFQEDQAWIEGSQALPQLQRAPTVNQLQSKYKRCFAWPSTPNAFGSSRCSTFQPYLASPAQVGLEKSWLTISWSLLKYNSAASIDLLEVQCVIEDRKMSACSSVRFHLSVLSESLLGTHLGQNPWNPEPKTQTRGQKGTLDQIWLETKMPATVRNLKISLQLF